MLYLQPVSLTDGKEFYDMLQRVPPEHGFENSVYQMEYAEFPAWLEKCVNMAQGIGLKEWQVSSGTYWLMDDGVPVAMGRLRHYLTDALRERGGHIGYAVDGTLRGKGYGKALLRLLLDEARRMGITEEILVTVNPGNVPSRRVAEANGGELRRETEEHVYYWFR